MTLNDKQKMELNDKLFKFFDKEIYDWVAKNFGTQEADDPSWNIEDLSANLARVLMKKVYNAELKDQRLYEMTLVLDAGCDVPEELNEIEERVKLFGGNIRGKEHEGVKTLPYTLAGQKRADFSHWEVIIPVSIAQALSSWLNGRENVLRHLLVRVEERRK